MVYFLKCIYFAFIDRGLQRMLSIGLVEAVTITFDFYFGKDDELIQAALGVLAALSEPGVCVQFVIVN
jgi:hypothetical protein